MTKQIPYLILVFFAAAAFCACGSYNCGEAEGLRISTVGLTAVEIDTIILRKFTKGSNFTSRIDTLSINPFNALFQFPYTTKDTSFMGILSEDVLLRSKYDYEIFIPSVGKLVRITAISEPQQRMKKGLFSTTKEYCINAIQSYQQDGRTITPKNNWQPEIYIQK